MRLIFAFDGGGTKTHLAVFDDQGHVLYQKLGLGCNHQSIGINHFKKVIGTLYQDALVELDVQHRQIAMVYLGISGADLPEDYEKLEAACRSMFNQTPFVVTNDAWIVMRSGLKSAFGAVAISGTGTNAAAIGHDGKKAILRSLGFVLGIYGGGLDIARAALHHAFRADELTYHDTLLKTEIPLLLDCRTMAEVVPFFYPTYRLPRDVMGSITALVNRLALAGDVVSQDILREAGFHVGWQTAGVIRQVGSEHETVPVVVGGRVFQSESPCFLEAFEQQLKTIVPKAYIIHPVYPPVVGAYLFALDHLGIAQDEKLDQTLKESWHNHEKSD
ncbi:MAG: ATPase [Acholeplasmataceae bacterium]|nr:MAG: ATPase [Acholeplasmataceae bacterium]